MATAGVLGIQITADDAELRAVMKRAAETTIAAFGGMEGAAGQFKKILAGLGIGISAAGIVRFATNTLDAAEGIDKLSQKTGIAISDLSELAYAANIADVSQESLGKGIKNLSAYLIEAGDPASKQAKLLKQLGVDVNSGALPALENLATAFAGIPDGVTKSALATEIFKKSGQELIPFLNQGADGIQKLRGEARALGLVLDETGAKAAAQFNDNLKALRASSSALGISLVNEFAPGLAKSSEGIKEALVESGKLTAAWVALGAVGSFLFTDDLLSDQQKFNKALNETQKDIAYLQSLKTDSGGLLFKILSLGGYDKDVERELASAQKRLGEFRAKQTEEEKKAAAQKKALADTDAKREAERAANEKRIRALLSANTGDDPAKKILDNQLRALERQGEQEKQTLANTFRALDVQLNDNAVAFSDYYDARRTLAEESLRSQQANYDEQIAALESFRDRSSKATDRAEAEGKIAALLDKKSKAQSDAAQQSLVLDSEQSKSTQAFADKIALTNAAVLELQGNLAKAAEIRFDIANRNDKEQFGRNGQTGALRDLEIQRQNAITQAQLNELNAQAARIGQGRANAETLINQAQQNGSLSFIGAAQAKTAARREEIAQLEVIYENEQKLVEISGNPERLQNLENLRVRLIELRGESDLLGQAFDNIFTSSAADGFAAFISGSKSAKQAFSDFVNSVVQQISKLAAQDLANALFKGSGSGGSGIGGGLFNFIGSLFGGGSGFTNQTAGGSFTLPGEGWAKGGAFDGARRFANGGMFTNGIVDSPTYFNPAVMGEAGPEAIMPLARDGSGRLGVRGGGGGTVIHQNITINTPDVGSFRKSESQIAAQMLAVLSLGNRNR